MGLLVVCHQGLKWGANKLVLELESKEIETIHETAKRLFRILELGQAVDGIAKLNFIFSILNFS